MEENKQKTILDIQQLSEYLNCGTSTIRKLIYSNDIPYFKILSKYYFDINLINRWIKKHNDIVLGGFQYEHK